MPYSYLSLAQARAQLAAKLYDTSANLFWSDAEKTRYIVEALRTWNSLTSIWRKDFTFNTGVNITWYDLTAQVNSLRPFTLTDNDLTQIIEYHLLEPQTSAYPLVWTGSAQFAITDILGAIQRRRDEVLSITGCTITQSLVPATLGRIFMPDTVIDIRRVAWIPVSNPTGFVNTPLWGDDQWSLQSFDRTYTTDPQGVPSSYRRSTEPPLSFDVDILPAIPGQYDVLSVNAGPALSTIESTLLGIPDDFTWIIKWGALADLLGRESNAKDLLRAQYCDMRYMQGLSALLNSPAVLYGRLNGVPLDIDSVQNTDDFRPGWQSETLGQPDLMMTAGLNLVGFAPTPNSVLYGVVVMVVQNAPVPVFDTDLVQVGRDDLEGVLDYAQHLASFKMGGQEFMSTIPLLDGFHKRCMLLNSKLAELGEFQKPTYELSQLQSETNPAYNTDEVLNG